MQSDTEIVESLDDERRRELYSRTYNTADGKLVLEDLRLRCLSRPSVPIAGTIDPLRLAFIEGQRSVWFHIQTVLNWKTTPPEDEGEGHAQLD